MTVSNELFMAILAMDAYNRGYGAGLAVDGTSVGDAVIIAAQDLTDNAKIFQVIRERCGDPTANCHLATT